MQQSCKEGREGCGRKGGAFEGEIVMIKVREQACVLVALSGVVVLCFWGGGPELLVSGAG